MNGLFDESDHEPEEFKITVNSKYADKFEIKKKREELSRLREKYGDDYSEGDESSSEEEDSDAELLTPGLDCDIMKTLALIKSKDPSIYNKDKVFFENASPEASSNDNEEEEEEYKEEVKQIPKKKKEKIVTLKDYERTQLLEKGAEGAFNEDESDKEREKAAQGLSYVEEQAKLKDDLIKVQGQHDDDSDDDDLFTIKVKTAEEEHADNEDYLDWLKDNEDKLDKGKNAPVPELVSLKRYWADPNLNEEEKFLRDYVLNKKWMDPEEKDGFGNGTPLIFENDLSKYGNDKEMGQLDEDLEEVEKMDEFERTFNFRYEEKGATELQTHSRTVEGSVRRSSKKEKNKEARDRKKERKIKKKLEKQEELKKLKSLKRQEIIEKLKEIQEISGVPQEGLENIEVDDGEWDEAKHEANMSALFGSEFYGAEDDEKPVFADSDEDMKYLYDLENEEEVVLENIQLEGEEIIEDEMSNNKKRRKKKKNANDFIEMRNEEYANDGDDMDFNMDADFEDGDYEEDYENEEYIQNSRANKRKQRRNEKKEMRELVKNGSKENKSKIDEVLDDYYALDFEDMIDDTPVRFQYRKVLPNNYGFTPAQILEADDKELNSWVSLKKMTKYRAEKDELYDKEKYSKMPAWKKRKIVPSAFSESSTQNQNQTTKDQNTKHDPYGKKQKQNNNSNKGNRGNNNNNNNNNKRKHDNQDRNNGDKKHKLDEDVKKVSDNDKNDTAFNRKEFNKDLVGESRLQAYGVTDKKKKKHKKK